MAPPRKALIAVTSSHAPLYPEGKETGLFITEALHPFNVFLAAAFEVDLASEAGEYQADYLSTTNEWLPEKDNKGLFFASAGHASLNHYTDAKGLQDLASEIYGINKGILGAVCHGGAIFPGILDKSTGNPVISRKKVTGFTTKGEEEEGVLDTNKSWNRPTIEASAKNSGAQYVSPPGPWDSFAITDGRLVTGANPASAQKTAEEAVKAFDKL